MLIRVKRDLSLYKALDKSKLVLVEVMANGQNGQFRTHKWKRPESSIGLMKREISKMTNIKPENLQFKTKKGKEIGIEKIVDNYMNRFSSNPNKPSIQQFIAKTYKVSDNSKVYEIKHDEKKKDKGKKEKEYSKEIVSSARGLIKKAQSIEKPITQLLKDTAKSLNAEMSGLEFRFKSLDSLSRKIDSKINEEGKTLETASKDMKDVLRYTMVLDGNNFVSGFEKTRDKLKEKGYNIYRVKNTFQDGNSYKGLNTNVKDSQGNIFELQFHTEKSLEIKMGELHEIYEVQRKLDKNNDIEKFDRLERKMVQISLSIPNPKNIDKIKSY